MTKKEYAQLAQIAREHIPGLEGRADLEPMHSDDLDFIDVSVWCLEDALAAAYELGKEAGKQEAQNMKKYWAEIDPQNYRE